MPTIRDNMKALRNIRGLSQNEVAEALHVTRQTVSSYETGRTEPDMETLKRLAELYKVDVRDVLYGGNRMQRKISFIRWAGFGISAVLVLSLLIHSALYLLNNTFFVIEDGTIITEENIHFAETRYALRDAADNIAGTGIGVFSVGCIVLFYPLITIRKACSTKTFAIWLGGLVLAILAVTVPFMLCDKVYGAADYFLPLLNALPCIVLLFLLLIIQICLHR